MNIIKNVGQKLRNAVGQDPIGLATDSVRLRTTELDAAKAAQTDAEARRKAAIELDEPDSIIDALDAEIERHKASIDRANDRKQVAERRLEAAKTDAANNARAVANRQLDTLKKTGANKTLEALAECCRAALKTVIAIAEIEIQCRELAKPAEQQWNHGDFERSFRARFDARELVIRSDDLELWCGRNSIPINPQPTNITTDPDGTTTMSVENTGWGTPWMEVFRKKFRSETFYPRDTGAEDPTRFAEGLNFPAIAAGRASIWVGKDVRGNEPEVIIAKARHALDCIDEQLSELRSGKTNRGTPETRLVPIND